MKTMKRDTKPSVALLGAFLFSSLICGTADAQSTLVESGTSYLADIFQSGSTSPETLNVSWWVLQNQSSGIYTYGFNVLNPVGDQGLNNNNTPNGIPETFDSFTISFNVGAITGYFQATPPAGGTVQNNGANGLNYTFPPVAPGQWSPLLAFQTVNGPTLGNASADGGGIPPGPWNDVLNNSPVPVPVRSTIPEPTSLALLSLTAVGFLGRRLRRS